VKAKLEKSIVLAVILTMSLLADTTIADLAAYYPLDEGSGSITADASGNRRHGTLMGTPTWIDSKSGYGKALYYNGAAGASGWVNCGTWNPSEQTGQLTVALWVRWDGAVKDHWQGVVAKRDGWSPDGKQMHWYIEIGGQDQQIAFRRGGSYPPCGGIVLPEREWQHVAATFDGATLVFYVNGQETGRGDFSFGAKSDSTIVIGVANADGSNGFNGALDEVCIFNNALSKDTVVQLYDSGGASFVSPGLLALLDSVRQAKRFPKRRSPQEALAFFKDKISEYELWERGNPKYVGLSSELLAADLHFLLANAKKAAGASTEDVIEAYKKSASISLRSPNYVPSLSWLFWNIPADDFIEFVKRYTLVSDGAFKNAHLLGRDFEASGDWAAFKLFLDGTLSEVNDTTACVKAIAEGLHKDGMWANKFLEYCRSERQSAQYVVTECEKRAQEYVEREEFSKAAEIYRDLANRCAADQDKSVYELKICECIFNGGQYSSALSKLDDFIRSSKSVNKDSVAKAMLLKGQGYIQLNEIDRARDIFSTLMKEYPETERVSEACFFIGYCNMLQGKHVQAAEALNAVVKNYPQDSCASKARLCLAKIKRMTE
jgi:tetratricopeptide (TPR) repeat protein